MRVRDPLSINLIFNLIFLQLAKAKGTWANRHLYYLQTTALKAHHVVH